MCNSLLVCVTKVFDSPSNKGHVFRVYKNEAINNLFLIFTKIRILIKCLNENWEGVWREC